MQFEGFGKIPRLNRECIVTEKIDGSNAQIFIQDVTGLNMRIIPQDGTHYTSKDAFQPGGTFLVRDSNCYFVTAGSRKRWIDILDDNFGFAKWVHDNANELLDTLGPGKHFGEWWGSGINRGYGLLNGEKKFSLFNTARWNQENKPECCEVVPQLYRGLFDTYDIRRCLDLLDERGSFAAPGYGNAEGIIIYHVAANQYFKATIQNDDKPKGSTE